MDQETYTKTQAELFELAARVEKLDLDGFIAMISHSEAVAPLLNPSLYMAGRHNLEIIKRMANGAAKFKAAVPTPEERGKMIMDVLKANEPGSLVRPLEEE